MSTSLPREKAVLIVCRALNPFVTFDLVRKTNKGVEPIDGAEEIRIKETLINLHMQDEKFGLHVIDFILSTIFDLCKQEGFSVTIGKGQLVTGRFTTIDSIATRLINTSSPLE